MCFSAKGIDMRVKIADMGQLKSAADGEYVAVRTCRDPLDETVTLATIQRVVEKTVRKAPTDPQWHIKTLVLAKPMTADAAIGFATLYAQRKHIPVVYTASES
jgi:hypothetical protein